MIKLDFGINKKTSTQLLRTLMFFIIIAIGINNSFANYSTSATDKKHTRKNTKIAKKFFANKNYSEAAPILYDLLRHNKKNAELNNMLGVCYFNLETEKEKSTEYLEKAIRYTKSKNNIPLDYYSNLGKSYHINYQFKKAIRTYNNLISQVPSEDVDYIANIKHKIEICKNAIELTENPVNMEVINLGDLINTEFAEHSPGVTADESTIVFTSRRNGTGSKIDTDGQYFEDIYISHRVDGVWTEPKGIDNLNTKDHDASISISADGQEIYVYKAGSYNNNKANGGDIYVSKLKGKNWTRPQKLHSDINSSSKESHISISADGKTIYFSSNRPGGYGKMDIYSVKKLPNGKWGPAQNLGPTVNTIYDEEAPFIHHDGINLYFSSKGHNTMGGFDVFKSTFENGQWNKPLNIGFPINSTKEDIYYTPTADGKRAYMASYREGSRGRADIFQIQTPDATNTGLFVLKGKLVNTKGEAVSQAKIKISFDNKIIGMYRTNTATGKFLFIIEAGKLYNVEIIAEGYKTLSTVMNVPADYANKENHNVITLRPLPLYLDDEDEDYPEHTDLIDYDASMIDITDNYIKPEEKPIIEKPKVEKVIVPITPKHSIEETYYTVQILALQLPINPEMFNYLDNVKIFQSEDGFSRYTFKKFKSYTAAKQELNRLIHIGYWDSFIRTVINGQLIYPHIKYSTSTAYTIQLMSLKTIKPVSYFSNLKGVNVYRDSDNIYRYTYKIFPSKYEAQLALGEVLKKNYWDAFVRKAYWCEEVLFSDLSEKRPNMYTIQIMALNHPKSLNHFGKLPLLKLNMNKGKDGLSRYTFEAFEDKKLEKTYLDIAFKKGYYDAFTRTIKWYNKN